MKEFKILITSSPDREKTVVEIWYSDNLIAEINQEKDQPEIEIYPSQKLIFNLKEFLEALEIGEKNLIS